MNFIVYVMIQTLRNFKHTYGTQLMTLLTVSLSVLIFSFFFLVYANTIEAGKKLWDDLRLTVYLEDEVEPKMQVLFTEKIKAFDEVEKITFISRQEAFQELAGQLGKDSDVLNDLDPSFLPPSINVYPEKNLKSLARIKQFSDYLSTLPGVLKVQYGQEWVERFGYITELLRLIVLMSGCLLILTTTFMVSYTIRLTVASRQEELEILRLLGATNSYIQGPLLIEGFLQGLFGALAGLASLYFLFNWIDARFSGPVFLNIFEFSFFPAHTIGIILAVSVLLCTGGSMISIRKFLRI